MLPSLGLGAPKAWMVNAYSDNKQRYRVGDLTKNIARDGLVCMHADVI